MNARRDGFTLIELLVVVALVSSLLAIAAPSFASFISNNRVTSATNDFLQGVTQTRGEALKRGRRVMMMPNNSSGVPIASGEWKYGWTIFAHSATYNYSAGVPINQLMTDTNLVLQHGPLENSITPSLVNGATTTQAFTDASNAAYVSFDGAGYPRTLAGTTILGGIRMTDSGGVNSIRTVCMSILGRTRVVKTADPCTGG